jgi:hypothetical protein
MAGRMYLDVTHGIRLKGTKYSPALAVVLVVSGMEYVPS